MAQLKNVVDPFGEVNVRIAAGGKVRVTATILMEPHKEGAQTGIALDGSKSMSPLYGVTANAPLSSVFVQRPATVNLMTPVAQKVCAYLARKLDADGGTTVVYWATGAGGGHVEVIGDLTADQAERHTFGPPKQFGTGTRLLPAVKYFVDRFADAPYGFYVFVTDGALHDLDEVKEYTVALAKQVARRERHPVKFVLIGVGADVDEKQMQELDDLEAEADLWDHKLASELRVLEQIFAEVVDANARVAPTGRILDPKGKMLADYSDVGLPAFLEFEAPASAAYFTLEVPGFRLHQPLIEGAQVPPREDTAPYADAVPAAPPPTPPPQPAPRPSPKAEPPKPAPAPPAVVAAAPPVNPDAALDDINAIEPTLPGLEFQLEFDKDNGPDIKLEKDSG